jgi:hypothetical protein
MINYRHSKKKSNFSLTLYKRVSAAGLTFFILFYVVISSLNCKTFNQYASAEGDHRLNRSDTVNQIQMDVPSCHPKPAAKSQKNNHTKTNPISCNYCIAICGGFGCMTSFPVLVIKKPITSQKIYSLEDAKAINAFGVTCKSRAPPRYVV